MATPHSIPHAPDDDGAGPLAEGAKRVSLWIQGPLIGLCALVGMTTFPAAAVMVWWSLSCLAAILECGVFPTRSAAGCRRAMIIGAVCASALYAVAVYCLLILRPDERGLRMFAVGLMLNSALFNLLKYYRQPKVFLIGTSPMVILLASQTLHVMRLALETGQPLHAIWPLAALVLFVQLFWTARSQLAASHSELRFATAAAQERERASASASRAKTDFLATMSHEIRTPLNGVLGMVQAMTADVLSDPQRERLAVIRQSGESLLAVLDDILDLSKVEAGKLQLEVAEFDLEVLARGAAATFTPMATRKGIVFDLHVADSARGLYRGDSTRVRQIIFNLVSNALKFTDAGHVGVSILYEQAALRVRVSDTGVGIAPDRMLLLFDKFVQADASTTRRFGGSGLGLSICRQLAELMGGSISASSIEGQGSVFEALLPIERVGEARAILGIQRIEADAGAQEPSERTEAPIRLLAAEDNQVNQLVLKTLLGQVGIEPMIVADGVEAVAAWERQEWDVILMDVQMPKMDGPTAARSIRAREQATGRRPTPIIAVTANAMDHQLADYVAAGMERLVAKPIDAAKLFETLQAVLDDQAPTVQSNAA